MPTRFLILIAATLFTASAYAEPAKPESTLRVRAILRKYCAECHDSAKDHRGEISVMDRAGLDRAERPWLSPGSANASQVMQLIDDGSMPPGPRQKPTAEERSAIREWINADAAAFPREFDDAYVLGSILADVKRLPAGDASHVRYFSLHNLMPDAEAPKLDSLRESLGLAITDLAGPKALRADAVDPFQLVYRVDLRKTGWDNTPFTFTVDEQGKKINPTNSKVNLFDVMLMEYPFGNMNADSPAFGQIADAFLKPAAQVTPVSYVRGDWFADVFAKSPVAKEVRDVLGLAAPPARPALSSAPPTAGKRPGTAIVPLDATTQPNIEARGGGIEIQAFEIGAPPTAGNSFTPKNAFTSGDRFWIHFRASAQVFIEFDLIDETGKALVLKLGSNNRADAGQDKYLSNEQPNRPSGFGLTADRAGTLRLTVFASEPEFPPGLVLNTKEQMNERIIHPFYTLPGVKSKYDFDPSRIAKKTIEFTIKPK
jgi:hypothetical protein